MPVPSAIPDSDNEEVIITGGAVTKTTVSVYNKTGHQSDLANLKQGREICPINLTWCL